MIDYSRVKRVRVPDSFAEQSSTLTAGAEYEIISDITPMAGTIRNDEGERVFIVIGCGQAWEILNPDTGEWEVAT